jgi:hypothetical protein
MEADVPARWRTTAAVIIIVVVAVVLLWQVIIGLTTSRWDLPVLTFLAFALWIAIYVFLSAHEESA